MTLKWTPECNKILDRLLKEFIGVDASVQRDTIQVSKEELTNFVLTLEGWALQQHCVAEHDDWEDESWEEWIEQNIDRLAEENDAFNSELKHRRN
jgi:hypothetical protein|tara:strand:- start:172 stop:456 length:285 start_codon:yes stop_codon:yes gene_type:complete